MKCTYLAEYSKLKKNEYFKIFWHKLQFGNEHISSKFQMPFFPLISFMISMTNSKCVTTVFEEYLLCKVCLNKPWQLGCQTLIRKQEEQGIIFSQLVEKYDYNTKWDTCTNLARKISKLYDRKGMVQFNLYEQQN